jgi:hypothetical protein
MDGMDKNFDAGEHRLVGGCSIWKKKADESCTLNLEVYEEQSSDGGSSEALVIVTSDNEVVESSGRDNKRWVFCVCVCVFVFRHKATKWLNMVK